MHTTIQRPASEIIRDIANTYGALSPENLCCDGELSLRKVGPKRRRLEKQLRALFSEYGRRVDEGEAYELARTYRMFGNTNPGGSW